MSEGQSVIRGKKRLTTPLEVIFSSQNLSLTVIRYDKMIHNYLCESHLLLVIYNTTIE